MNAPADSDFALLLARHEREVIDTCTLVLREPHLAHDAAQEAFARLWRASVHGDAPEHAGAWLRAVAARAALDLLRRRRLRAAIALDDRATADPHLEPLDAAAFAELRQRFDAAVAALPERQQLTFRLRHEGGVPLARVAEVLGIALPTAKTHFARACLALQAALADFRDPPNDEP